MNRRTVVCTILSLALGVLLCSAPIAWADEMYARSRTYDLQNARIELRFDTAARKVMGDVTHTLAPLRDGLTELEFDSVDLQIDAVTVDGKAAKFETKPNKLVVQLGKAARAGQKLSVRIRYQGQPKRGLYFILPDKEAPDRPVQIWTQGQTEDTRYYIPIYDYPNDRTASEVILTVPAAWNTVSNGRLITTRQSAAGMKTWHWRQSQPHSTYLIALVAGELDVTTDSAAGVPLSYFAPRGRGNRLAPTYGRSGKMMDYFVQKFGPYPWEKYAQAMVDEFVAGGMENTSVTINTSDSLTHPDLVPEYIINQDDLISHELAHQWFGDLITTKDWGNVWLSESFASYLESLWLEHHYGPDVAAWNGWNEQNRWFAQERLFAYPLVAYNVDSFVQVTGNVYGKGSRIVHMLRHELGDEDFFRALRHFLVKYRLQNVVSADLARAIEESTGKNVDLFFNQWVYGAGAPRLAVSYTWDAEAKQVKLSVAQTQRPEGRVGTFTFPVAVDVMTAAGTKSHALQVSKAEDTFSLASNEEPLAVVFDPQNVILKRVDFKKEPADWAHQLQHPSVTARMDAARALGRVKENAEALAALGRAARGDKFWAVRSEAVRALGQIGGTAVEQHVAAALADENITVRRTAADILGRLKDNPSAVARLAQLYQEEKSWRVREAALDALARHKPEGAFATLRQAIATQSPDDILRNQALRSLGELGKEEAVPLLLEWSAPGKPGDTRNAAIGSLAQLDKKNGEITRTLLTYLAEARRSVRFQFTVFQALLEREDASAVEPMERWLDGGTAGILEGFLRPMLAQFKQRTAEQPAGSRPAGAEAAAGSAEGGARNDAAIKQILETLQRLERQLAAMSERVKKIEGQVGRN